MLLSYSLLANEFYLFSFHKIKKKNDIKLSEGGKIFSLKMKGNIIMDDSFFSSYLEKITDSKKGVKFRLENDLLKKIQLELFLLSYGLLLSYFIDF